MSFLFGSNITAEIILDDYDKKQKIKKTYNKEELEVPIYHKTDDVTGNVVITMRDKKYEHIGIKIEFIGSIEYSYDRTATSSFLNQTIELSRPSIILEEKTIFPFNFSGIEKKLDSYSGKNVRLRYYLKLSIMKKYSSGITKEQEIWVVNYGEEPKENPNIVMDVGVERCVSIEFRYAKTFYSLTDVVLGTVDFKNVRLPLQSMELQIQKKETTGYAPNQNVETEVLARYEIMDGAPVRGESMPIRVFLANLDLTPTYKAVNNMFSVTYHLHLVLIEQDGKRYFKQCEFKLYRKDPNKKEVVGQMFGVEDKVKPKRKHKSKKSKKEKKEEEKKVDENVEKKVEEVKEVKVEENVEKKVEENVIVEENVEKKEENVVEEKQEIVKEEEN